MKHLLTCFLLLAVTNLWGQKFTLSGYITDQKSGENLIGATIYVDEIAGGTSANAYGYYSLTMPKGKYLIQFSYVGYDKKTLEVNLNENQELNVELKSITDLQGVVISAETSEKIQDKTQMSTVKVSMDKVNSLPALMGEKDLIKTIQLLPGVQSGTEGASGLYVRGGGPDQNLILIDGVPVYNASHLFGFFSVFNADAIKSVELVKGGFPARYGGRLSSVLDIRMKEGNMNKFEVDGSVGVIASKVSIQGPIVKDQTSFIVSARRTYIDVLAQPIIRLAGRNQGTNLKAGYFFYDLNGKINHKFSNKSRLYLSTYLGNDKFYFNISNKFIYEGHEHSNNMGGDLKWGNNIAALRWNYQINPKLFSNTTITYSRYNFNTFSETGAVTWTEDEKNEFLYYNSFRSGIDDITAKVDFDFVPTPNHYIKFGAGDIYHTFTPGVQQTKFEVGDGLTDTTTSSPRVYGHELYAYIEDDMKLGTRWKINPGLYLTMFQVESSSYPSIQPRLAVRYLAHKNISLKASYAHMAQFLHLLSNPTIGLPTDLWVPATKNVAPEYSHQVAVGYAQNILDKFELSIEGYYKTMENLIEYKDGASFYGQDKNWENKIEMGRGWSYGGEFLLEKKQGKFSGWIGYTLSWTERQFDNINFGEPFFYRYDRRHDIGIALTYKHSEKWDYGLVWVYGTGNAFTLGLERYLPYNDPYGVGSWYGEYEHIDTRNNFRAPAYHRLDFGANRHWQHKQGKSTLNMGVYNAYSRLNPFFIYWGESFNFFTGEYGRALKQISIFPIIPSISYTFNFG
ncbi:MAG: TonB-dependent receptor [Bacteroidetes bacterium]|nr:TonB-dependent receptor [Bacteroidota bacterium]